MTIRKQESESFGFRMFLVFKCPVFRSHCVLSLSLINFQHTPFTENVKTILKIKIIISCHHHQFLAIMDNYISADLLCSSAVSQPLGRERGRDLAIAGVGFQRILSHAFNPGLRAIVFTWFRSKRIQGPNRSFASFLPGNNTGR
jgi:hypothetical protein